MRWLGLMVGAWLALFGAARAQDNKAGPALNWTRQPGAESCIASVELAARIEARVKQRIFVAAPEAIVAVEGYVAPDPAGGFRANIAMSDGQGALYGSRELTTTGACGELDEGLVFVIAVTLRPEAGSITGIELPEGVASALDSLFGAEPTEPEPSDFPTAPPREHTAAPEPKVPEPAKPVQPEGTDDHYMLFLEALGVGRLGLQPVGSIGGGAGARVAIEGLGSVALHGAVLATTEREIIDRGRPSRASFSGQLVTLAYCTPTLLAWSALSFEACASGSFGAVKAKGVSFDSNKEETSSFGSAGLAPRLALSVAQRLIFALAVGPELHLARPLFVYGSQRDDNVELYKATAIGAAAELSVAFAPF